MGGGAANNAMPPLRHDRFTRNRTARTQIAAHPDRCRDQVVVAPAAKTARRFPLPPRHPLGPYVVDFFCAGTKLIGGQHADDGGARTRWLEARGYRVIRFWNNDVLANTDGVLRMILDALRAAPHPTSPSRGEG